VIYPIVDQLQTPRLGEGSHKTGNISEQAIERTIKVLIKYKELALSHAVDSITLSGTSALRDAINRRYVMDAIKKRIGYSVSVLEGDEEALLSFRGALSGFPSLKNRIVVIDVGGGSTEVAYYARNKPITLSFPLGAVRLTEQFLKNDPPTQEQLSAVVQHIHGEFKRKQFNDFAGSTLIGVAGTPTTLACLDQELAAFNTGALDGYLLKYDSVLRWTLRLSALSSKQIRSLSPVTEGREDILIAASYILKEFIQLYNFPGVLVSTRGLRYGLALKEWDKRGAKKTAV
jgi:exopolyphosphatase/guanosine-5'-triphosphate,3'-diphosphate pyrophosphatase